MAAAKPKPTAREVDTKGNCTKCGGTHYGSKTCPQVEEKATAKPNTATPPKGTGLKITPERAYEALGVIAVFVAERVEFAKDKSRLGNAVGAIKVMHSISQFTNAVSERVKAPLEEAYNSLRFNIVPTMMEDEEIDKITVEDVGRVNVMDDLRLSVKDKVALNKWMIENDFEDLITSTVNTQTLTAFFRKRIKEGMKQDGKELPDAKIVEVTPIVRAQLTKS